MSFGALYIVFNSDFNEVCDYSDIVDNCNERKIYKDTDIAWENEQLKVDFLVKAQNLRNDSEIEKCKIETDLLRELQVDERTEAEEIVKKCMTDFRACVQAGYTTTTPAPQMVDCTACNRFCTSTNWDTLDREYAELMGFPGGAVTQCTKESCPWLPECGEGQFIHEKCSLRGCPCNKVPCPTTTVTTILPTTTTTMGSTTTATTTTTTATTTTATTTVTTATTFTTTTTTSTTTTSTTTSRTTTTFTTTTSTTTTSTTTTSTTTTSTTTTSTTTAETTTTTTSTIGCFCDPGAVATVIIGRPYMTFFKEEIQGADQMFTGPGAVKNMEYWQGLAIETYEKLPLGGLLTKGCRSHFSNRSLYVGPRQASNPAQAQAAHFDLSCGYSGQFEITCGQTPAQKAAGTCGLHVDISTCSPPSYSQALDACYTVPVTTTMPTGPILPTVPDWLGVEDVNFSLAELPPFYNITTQTTTPYPCCEVHVGSVCRPDQNFIYPAKTVLGRWQPDLSYKRETGYFPVVPCDQQAKSQPRKCPRVKIKEINQAYWQWPHCLSACSNAMAQANFMKVCNRTANPDMEVKEKAAHKKKIASMAMHARKLEDWTAQKMPTVISSKEVIDCFADRLPRRYNSLALPQMRTGFEKMPLHNQCRLHQCTAKQCLTIKRTCNVPFVHVAPEVMCNVHRPNGTFECVEKISIMSNNPMSLGFGIAWMIIGSVFLCAGIASFIRTLSSGPA